MGTTGIAGKLISRYVVADDRQPALGGWEIPSDWWSRLAEYPWAARFAEPGHTVLDAACGIPHFFKFYLASVCEEVQACDKSKKILRVKHQLPNLHLSCTNIVTHLPYDDAVFDRVFCISVLEHLPPAGIKKVLRHFSRVLKPDGLAVITFDIPPITLEAYVDLIERSPFVFAGPVELEEPENILIGHPEGAVFGEVGIKVFMSVLRKKP